MSLVPSPLARAAQRRAQTPTSQVFYHYRFDLVGREETKDAAVKVKFRLHRPLDILRLTKAVALALEGDLGHRQLLVARGDEHGLGLARRHHLVL